MKKALCVTAFLIITIVISEAQSNWINYKVDNHISVKFPASTKNVFGMISATGQDGVACVVMTGDLNPDHIDPKKWAIETEKPEFAHDFKVGMQDAFKQDTGENLDLQDFTLGHWQGLVTYTSSGFDARKTKYLYYLVIYSNMAYILMTVTKDGIKNNVTDNFFHSIVVTK